MGLQTNIGDHAVHMCIDMQRLFSKEGPWPTPWLERVLPAVVGIVGHQPERTVFTWFITPPTPHNMQVNGATII
jgi:nicotinamidase-related amidase